MVNRSFWKSLVEQAWRRRPLIWLCGARRAGKTVLCRSLEKTEYFDCELPRVRRMMEDPEGFLGGLKGKRIVLDEVHRLGDPSQLLKIAADHFPSIRVIATGSSTLEATARFRDKLTGRKLQIWLTPMNSEDLADFGKEDLRFRLLRGGLPPFFLSRGLPEREFQEWLDSYWAKDIQELFRLERRPAFLKLAELLFAQSGGIFEATRFASPCEISRATVSTYLSVLEASRIIHVIRPFSSRKSAEIVAAPKTYAFDTGFVCYFRGWESPRPEDLGVLWEHYVLNDLQSRLQETPLLYWRDKLGHEVDFVLARRNRPPLAVECKWAAATFDPSALSLFRKRYPSGDNLAVCSDVERPFERSFGPLKVRFCGVKDLRALLS